MVRIFYLFFSFSSFPILPVAPLSPKSVLTLFSSSRCKLQFLHSPSTQAPAQRRQRRPKPLPNANPSPCPTPTMRIDFFVLRPYLSAISFFLYSVSQSFSVSNTKTHDRRCWVSILSPWLTKQRCRHGWVLCWWVLFLFWWMGFDFVDGWWMGFVDGWWMVAEFLWFRGGFWLIWWLMMGSIFILMNGYWFCWWLMNGVCWWLMNGGWVSLIDEWRWRWRWLWLWLMVEVVVVSAVDVFWVMRYIILL